MKASQLALLLTVGGLVLVPWESRADFLTNGDFSAGNTGFTSGYTDVPDGSRTTPGAYGIISNPAKEFTNGFASFGDHTTGSGLMLFYDGTGGQSPIWSETISVAPNTAFVFTGWATSGTSDNPPILRLAVNGAAVGSDFSVNGATPGLWQEFTASFNSGPSTSLTLSIFDVNPSPIAPGDDGGIDDLSLTGQSVPEPSSLILCGIGLAGAICDVRRRKKAARA